MNVTGKGGWRLQPNPLHEKTNMLLYLHGLFQDFLDKSIAVIIGSDMINNVLFWDVSQYLFLTCDTILKVFFGLCRVFLCWAIHFQAKETYFFQNFALFTKNSMKGTVGRALKEDNSHLWSQIFHNITETMWNIFLYYNFIVKIASEHNIYIFCKKEKEKKLLLLRVSWHIHLPPCRGSWPSWRYNAASLQG